MTPTDEELHRAAEVLRDGGLVAFPTETVYGLGADATSPTALQRLYAVKRRPLGHPVIVHLADRGDIDTVAADVPPAARRLAARWPAPLTLVLTRRAGAVADQAAGGLATIGVRVPDHPLARRLIELAGRPIAAPSANRFGRVSPTTAQHVHDDLGGDVDVVLDGGPCRVGVESTIVDCTTAPLRILRPGGVSRHEVEEVAGEPARLGGRTPAPGNLASHYAPDARVEVVSATALARRAAELLRAGVRVAWLGIGNPELPREVAVLTGASDVRHLAAALYSSLRAADAHGVEVVLATPLEGGDLADAVNDRLARAASAGTSRHEARGER